MNRQLLENNPRTLPEVDFEEPRLTEAEVAGASVPARSHLYSPDSWLYSFDQPYSLNRGSSEIDTLKGPAPSTIHPTLDTVTPTFSTLNPT